MKNKALFLLLCASMAVPFVSAQNSLIPDTLRQHILTPAPKETPRINGAKVFGVRPGSPFFYTIAATGKRPMLFAVKSLPVGLTLDQKTGILKGVLTKKGTYKITLIAKNDVGSAERELRIEVGDKIGLTPAMGWNSWNCWGGAVDQEKVLSSAKAMVEKGLIHHGWSYINIDDGWQGKRGGKHNAIMPNKNFPDMKGLSDQIHAMGLRMGIYSGPWVGTYQARVGSYADYPDGTYDFIKSGMVDDTYLYTRIDSVTKKRARKDLYHHGKYSFVKQDVAQWMDWNVDYLKYDWHPNDYYHVKEMHDALKAQKRDIIYSLSNNAPYADAMVFQQYSHLWRTTEDIRDTWKSVEKLGFSQAKWGPFVGPGHFADPDMLVLGLVGWGPQLHYTKLTVDEQYAHMSLWSLLSAPLLIGCDMAQLDDFTLSLLTNDEVIEVNQDPLGKMAMPVYEANQVVVYQKALDDGSIAVGIFNRSAQSVDFKLTWKMLGVRGSQTVRDLWRQQDLGKFDKEFLTPVRSHGVRLIKIYPGNSKALEN